MKLVIRLSIVALAGCVATQDHGQDEPPERLEWYVMTAASGTLVGDHVGPKAAEEGARVLQRNGEAANEIIARHLGERWGPDQVANLSVHGALRLTAESDPTGSLRLALRLRSLIDDGLAHYDAASRRKDNYLVQLGEEERNQILRLIDRRGYVQRLILDLTDVVRAPAAAGEDAGAAGARPQDPPPATIEDALTLLRSHVHGQPAPAGVIAAATQVFAEVNFTGLSPEEVRCRLGPPQREMTIEQRRVWGYSYSDGRVSMFRMIWFDAADRVFGVEAMPTA